MVKKIAQNSKKNSKGLDKENGEQEEKISSPINEDGKKPSSQKRDSTLTIHY
jgi:hypothetical protein